MAVVLVRPAGIMLGGGFGVVALAAARRREISWMRALALSLALGLPACGAQAFTMLRERAQGEEAKSKSYLDFLFDPNVNFAEQLLDGLRLRIQETGRLLVPGMYKVYAKTEGWLHPSLLIYAPLFVAVVWGWLRLVRRQRDPYAWMFPGYLALYIVWPFDQATRFFLPLFPLLVGCLTTLAPPARAGCLRAAGIAFCLAHLGVALGYWLASERPAAMKLQAAVPVMRQVAAAVPRDTIERVAVSDRLGDRWMWLEFLVDRRVELWKSGQPSAKVRDLVCLADQAPPAGFTLIAKVDDYRIYRRMIATEEER